MRYCILCYGVICARVAWDLVVVVDDDDVVVVVVVVLLPGTLLLLVLLLLLLLLLQLLFSSFFDRLCTHLSRTCHMRAPVCRTHIQNIVRRSLHSIGIQLIQT